MPTTFPPAFISYSRVDSQFVQRLVEDLRAAGAYVWLDQADITPGHHWDDAIEEALRASRQMVLILSPASAQSRNVRNEIAFALGHEKEIIPVLHQECEVPLQLQRHQRIDFRNKYSEGLQLLLGQLHGREGRPPGAASTTPANYPIATKQRTLLSRRNLILGSTVAVCGVAAGVAFNRQLILDEFYPLPAKRFVAVLGWPFPNDSQVAPAVATAIDAIVSELTRYEAADHNLLIITRGMSQTVTNMAQLNEFKESLGANLVLAMSGQVAGKVLELALSVIDPASGSILRNQIVHIPRSAQLSITEKTVPVAARLLGIREKQSVATDDGPGTTNSTAYAYFQQAEEAMQIPNYAALDTAIQKYTQAVALDGSYAVAQTKLAWAYLRSYGMRSDAAALDLGRRNALTAIQHNPNLADAHTALAEAYKELGQPEEAYQEIGKALSIDPNDVHALTYQGNFYAADNRWEESESAYLRVLSLRPNYWLAHVQLGYLLGLEGKFKEALLKFREASLLNPKDSLALKNVGSTYLMLGQLAEALSALNASYSLDKNDNAAASMAEVFRVQRNYPKAIGYAEMATKASPADPDHWVELGDVYSSAGKPVAEIQAAYSKAAETQNDSLHTSPDDGPGWMNLALCKAKLGETGEAKSLIAKAGGLHAGDMDSQLTKVRILELVGLRSEAFETMKQCLARGATMFQFETMPDLEQMRATPEYRQVLVKATTNPT